LARSSFASVLRQSGSVKAPGSQTILTGSGSAPFKKRWQAQLFTTWSAYGCRLGSPSAQGAAWHYHPIESGLQDFRRPLTLSLSPSDGGLQAE